MKVLTLTSTELFQGLLKLSGVYWPVHEMPLDNFYVVVFTCEAWPTLWYTHIDHLPTSHWLRAQNLWLHAPHRIHMAGAVHSKM